MRNFPIIEDETVISGIVTEQKQNPGTPQRKRDLWIRNNAEVVKFLSAISAP